MVAINKVPQFGNIGSIGGGNTSVGGSPSKAKGPSFQDALNSVVGAPIKNVNKNGEVGPLKFSNHAVSRMTQRGMRFDPAEMTKIEGAVNKARLKGAKETLVLTDNAAMIVSVKNNTIVTVLDRANMKENVFTNIDSTVMV